jgi:hypothetical protein
MAPSSKVSPEKVKTKDKEYYVAREERTRMIGRLDGGKEWDMPVKSMHIVDSLPEMSCVRPALRLVFA